MAKKFSHKLRVRYFDVDAMGHVNNAAYFTYMEEARTLFLMKVRGYKGLEKVDFILIEQSMRYLKELHYGDEVTISVFVGKIGNSSFVLHYHLTCRKESIGVGKSVMLLYDYKKKKKKKIDSSFRRELNAYQSEKAKES